MLQIIQKILHLLRLDPLGEEEEEDLYANFQETPRLTFTEKFLKSFCDFFSLSDSDEEKEIDWYEDADFFSEEDSFLSQESFEDAEENEENNPSSDGPE